ncbi:acetate CoA/acetoacetate CoA-transferase alpha subunit [Sporomusaceae bacterium BoRhaA]|uniref:CoA transferase subunit A n=1 Tax=Pelorhabdus rhamnosifermentans TaxID=2772457 RepID=UPI001C063FB3|nr:3-oxoacid CoA-transferase subunit A [Pelorhabdus rhamnosifermentans]MBU2702044.1 acetate CoA/acetoacetate CoA-transferase alpha subunit [Pelorhabdus rhamnosifermentans]
MNKTAQLDQLFDKKVHDGMTIMIGGFLGTGAPITCIEKLVERKVKNLTIISAATSIPGGNADLALLFQHKQVKKIITSHMGTCPEAVALYKQGGFKTEYFPLGSLIEKIRAGGAGLGGILTPIGLGTAAQEGKQVMTIAGKDYLLELPLRAELAFIKAFRADQTGNLQYRGTAVNTNTVMATAADYTIAEVNEIVDVGTIEPERVGTPGIFIRAIVQGYSLEEQHQRYRKLLAR